MMKGRAPDEQIMIPIPINNMPKNLIKGENSGAFGLLKLFNVNPVKKKKNEAPRKKKKIKSMLFTHIMMLFATLTSFAA